MANVPQFGEPQPGVVYPDRRAAFAIVVRDGMIATAQVTFPDGGGRLDLPGGGIDAGEEPAAAAARECGEEVGLRVRGVEEVARADHYFTNEEGRSVNTRGVFFAAELLGEAPELKVEDDHALVWMTPHEALVRLSRDAHAWALAAWLRKSGGA